MLFLRNLEFQFHFWLKKNSRADEILIDDNCVNEIIWLDRLKNKSGYHDGVKGFFNLIKLIKSKKFDKVYIFNSSIRYYLIAKISGIKNIFQYPLFRKKDNIVNSAKIFTENEMNQIISTEPVINLNKNKIDKIQNNLSKDFKYICLGVSASGPTKRWDIKNYINLCLKLNKEFPCKFFIAGGRGDKNLINQLLDSEIGSNCVSFENMKIGETMPIIKNCNLYIGNDTGWLHLSSGLGLKCVAIFMDSPVMAYGKYSNKINVIIPEGQTEESTTHLTRGKDKISFEKVFKKTIELLN